jgi:hypothetical protein
MKQLSEKRGLHTGLQKWLQKGAVLLTLLLFANTAHAAIRISPSYIELDANKTKKDYIADSFTVAGGKDEVIRFKVYPQFFEYDTKGRFVELADKGQNNSLISHIKFFPAEFTCQNGAEQKVRFTLTDLKSLPTGDSRVILFLEDLNTKEVAIKKANGDIGGKIIVKTRVGVPIYLDKGLYSKKGNLETLALKKIGEDYQCNYKISSMGNSKIRYTGYAYLSQGKELIKQFDIHGMSVAGGKFIEAAQKLDIPKDKLVAGQEYKIKFVLTYKDEKNNAKVLKKELTFIPNGTI